MYLHSSCDDNCCCEFVDDDVVDMREEDWRGISLSQLSLFVSYDFVAIDFVAAADDGGMPRRRRNAGGHDVPPDALPPLPLPPDDDNDDIIAEVCRAHSARSWGWGC